MTERIERKATNHLRAILQAATDLIDEVGIPHNSDDLHQGPRIRQIAFCECVRRAGEAVAQIDALDPAWLPDRFPDVPWRDVKATRNFLTHHYWTVDYGILHRIATVHLPAITAPISIYLGLPDPYADGIGD